jgi:CBS domain-containing protein
MTKDAARLRAALLNPAAVFGSPEEVERDARLSQDDKLAILKSWEEDARELAVAEDENMAGGEPSRLEEVVAARVRLTGAIEQSAKPHERASAGAEPAGQPIRRFARPVREIVHADHEIEEAALRLSLQEHAVLPVSDGDQIVGVIARTELAKAAKAKASGTERVTARVVMATDLAFCYLDDDVTTAHALMDRHGCRHLMVVDRDRVLVGTLERDDLPPVSERVRRALQARPEIVAPRETHAQGVASTIQPGGLDVYAERPKLKVPRD